MEQNQTIALRNFKDFLLQYNRISESCFSHCIDNLASRPVTKEEAQCVDLCTKKHVRVNHKVIQIYMEVQPQVINKRMDEMSKQAEINQTKLVSVQT